MLRPILPHTVEEVYTFLNENDKAESIHLLDMRAQDFVATKEIQDKYNLVLKLRNDVNEALEQARNNKIIKKSFEAVVDLKLSAEATSLKDIADLTQILIVNSINFVETDQPYVGSISSVNITLKEGLKCERC
ncbi:hypothetical protein Zmor_027123 [Zophobas morio]|uniref:Methionyl/Valyl/Leucyl/Isoleucyl-tRNA synthetase anticodon-binding domain-containing protein n=1 Tax=Zophobas morio TaxID=2755281 RepID=A0AA38HL05_9CUCU|nr:hypothetical protein Zmor_027123 [Zophobas morio]